MQFQQDFFTDYPFTQLGDIGGEEAPIRQVRLISHDGDKYATVGFEDTDVECSVKTGYLYTTARRFGDLDDDMALIERNIVNAALDILPND